MIAIRPRLAYNGRGGLPGGILRLNRGHPLCMGLQFALFPTSFLDLVYETVGTIASGTLTQPSPQGLGTSPTPTDYLGMGWNSIVSYSYLTAINPPLSIVARCDYGTGTVASFGGSGTGHGWACSMQQGASNLQMRFTFGGVADYTTAAITGTTANGGVYTAAWTVDHNLGTFSAYINGYAAGTVAVGTMLGITQPFTVAAARTASAFAGGFTKTLDCILVYNRVISPAEVSMLNLDPYQILYTPQRIYYGPGVLFRPRPMSIMT